MRHRRPTRLENRLSCVPDDLSDDAREVRIVRRFELGTDEGIRDGHVDAVDYRIEPVAGRLEFYDTEGRVVASFRERIVDVVYDRGPVKG